jgi:hypothetical protein
MNCGLDFGWLATGSDLAQEPEGRGLQAALPTLPSKRQGTLGLSDWRGPRP